MERRDSDFLTLTRKDSVLEVHQVFNLADGEEDEAKLSFDWSYLHDYYHPLPNQEGQGKEGSALVYVWTSDHEAKEHRRVQVLVGRSGESGSQYQVSSQDGKVYVTCNGETVMALILHSERIIVCRKWEFRSWEFQNL